MSQEHMSQLNKRMEEAARELEQAHQTAQKAQDARDMELARQAASDKEIARVLKDRVTTMFDTGTFSPYLIQAYYKYSEQPELDYSWAVARMLSDKTYGVEVSSPKFRNGSITWNGKTFETYKTSSNGVTVTATQHLFDRYQEILGRPFNYSIRWFEKYLSDYLNDPIEFQEILERPKNVGGNLMTFDTYHQYVQRYFGSYEPSEIDIQLLTAEGINYAIQLGFLSL